MSVLPQLGLDFALNAPLDEIASEMALRRLTGDLVSGRLRPGTKLKLRELIERYGIGAHPLREALAQLVARELVVFEGNKGFRAAPVSKEQVLDITRTRQIAEVAALELAMAHGTTVWEEEIVANSHCLNWRSAAVCPFLTNGLIVTKVGIMPSMEP